MKKSYTLNQHSGLILEGGGMRGVFTIGVLDNLMDRGIRFPYSIGVSAGACNGLSYMSNQRGRAKMSNIDLMEKYHYISLKNLIFKRNLIDFDLLFDVFPKQICPYDYAAFAQCKERFEVVTTSCESGQACYYDEHENPQRIIDIVQASSSLPFVCPIAYVDGQPMLDGGIADSIPLLRARSQGYDNNLVILTRNQGYRKSDKPSYLFGFYRQYPHLREAIRNRNALYNKQLDYVEKEEAAGNIIVIRPEKPIQVDRMERNTQKLLDLYQQGYDAAASLDIYSTFSNTAVTPNSSS